MNALTPHPLSRLPLPALTALSLLAAGCAAGETVSTTGGQGGSGATATTSETGTSATGKGGSGGDGGAGGQGGSGGAGGCQDTCAQDFPTVPECQKAVWDPAKCECALIVSGDGADCSDGNTCTVGDTCKAGVCEKGPDVPPPDSCQVEIDSISEMPPGSVTLNFDSCVGCPCCTPEGAYPSPLGNDCVTCSIDGALAEKGITRKGGSGTSFVSCITGNASAPIGQQALFVDTTFSPGPGGYGIELTFPQGVSFFGFSAVPTSSNSMPLVVLKGYSAEGDLVGEDTFDWSDWPAGTCEVANPAARFFGFRACCGTMTRVTAWFTDPNAALDSVTYF
jgi:hypothetical protein